jgi:hypothetical protein
MLKSFIVQKDEDTLIVSQHIPGDFNIDKSYQIRMNKAQSDPNQFQD